MKYPEKVNLCASKLTYLAYLLLDQSSSHFFSPNAGAIVLDHMQSTLSMWMKPRIYEWYVRSVLLILHFSMCAVAFGGTAVVSYVISVQRSEVANTRNVQRTDDLLSYTMLMILCTAEMKPGQRH